MGGRGLVLEKSPEINGLYIQTPHTHILNQKNNELNNFFQDFLILKKD